MIGVSFGAPTEFKATGKILDGELAKWTPDACPMLWSRMTSTST